MALTRKGVSYAQGLAGYTCDGVEVTSAEASLDLQTNFTIQDALGITKTWVYGNPKATVRVNGYTTSGDLPPLGGVVVGAGETTRITSSRVAASNEDFTRVSVTAEAFIGEPANDPLSFFA